MNTPESGDLRKPSMQGDAKLATIEAEHLRDVGEGIRVLIAEDERDTLMTLGILLRSEAFEVRMVDDGADVAALVAEFKPHAVLLDIGMPRRDGYQVASELRSQHGPACPTLIAITAYASAADKVRAHRSGFHHHLPKPYDPVRLLALLASVKSCVTVRPPL